MFKKTNFARVLNNIYFQKNEPVSLVHFITNRCNARCSFCFIDFDNPETFKGELTIEEIDKLVDKSITWTDQVILTHIYNDNEQLFYKLSDGWGKIIPLLY